MDHTVSLPTRFVASSKPHDGLVVIKDTETGREGDIRLQCYQSVASLFYELFGAEDGQQVIEEAPATADAGAITPQEAAPEPVAAEEQPAPQKRGRRKKAEVVKEAAESAAPEVSTPVEDAPVAEVAEPAQAETPAPKKRGRPKKAAAEVAEPVSAEVAEPAQAEAPAPKKRGRAKKVVSEAADTAVETPAPKKRGRPKKAAAEAAEPVSAEVTEPARAEAPAPKKRGRPKKAVAAGRSKKEQEGALAEHLAEDITQLPLEEPQATAKKPDSKAKAATSAKKKAAAPKKAAPAAQSKLEPVINHAGFKLVLQDSQDGYDIVLDNGGKFGSVKIMADKRAHVETKEAPPSDHASLTAARARVHALVNT